MLKTTIQLPLGNAPDADRTALRGALQQKCRLHDPDPLEMVILKKSLDARRKNTPKWIYSVAFACRGEERVLQRVPGVSEYTPKTYRFPYAGLSSDTRPVVVGMGPAGLFAALMLAKSGLKPILLERGQDVETRTQAVSRFWERGILNPESNVQFGEGGAGTFSDGKLSTGVSDERIPFVLKTFIRHGAPEALSYAAKPHIGTDVLKKILVSLRGELVDLGCEIRFQSRLTGLRIRDGVLEGIRYVHDGKETDLDTGCLILALGNSARDTFSMLYDAGIRMIPKAFAVGVRIEHLQKEIDLAQYGQLPTLGLAFPQGDRSFESTLPASDYKYACHLSNGHSVFSFCVCPGGKVVASASEEGQVVTNGMSESRRDGENINGGMLVSIPAEMFKTPMEGIEFQRELEKSAFLYGGSSYQAPCQRVGDFLRKRPSTGHGKILPTYRPGVRYCNLWDVLPEFLCESIAEALPQIANRIHGFADPDALLTAVESRSSCPVCIVRDEQGMSNVRGIYPCGEGAGYAGGIMSAAVDGIRCAQAVCARLSGGLENP
ncbi:MAG: hypothetical protein II781_00770 [Clostridia bacterium]|nr:hypothetical protein [Clostridia bacterium]